MGKMIHASVLLAMLVASMSARAELVVENAYVRASLPGSDNASAYMMLRNTGDTELVITRASTPAAAKVSFHSTMNHDGMVHMMGTDTLRIPAHKSLVLESGGTHLMLEKMAKPLAEGSTVELTLQTADGQRKTVTLTVKSVMNEKQ